MRKCNIYPKIVTVNEPFLNLLYRRRKKGWTWQANWPIFWSNCSLNLAQWRQMTERGFLHLVFPRNSTACSEADRSGNFQVLLLHLTEPDWWPLSFLCWLLFDGCFNMWNLSAENWTIAIQKAALPSFPTSSNTCLLKPLCSVIRQTLSKSEALIMSLN